MVLTATGVVDSAGTNGLWLGSAAASNTLSRPDTALIYPQNCVFGAIAKGDDSTEREGDKVDLIYIANKYQVTITWGTATVLTQATQQLNCLEFLLVIKNPNTALAICIDMDTEGDDYNDNIMRILTASGCFAQQYTGAEIVGATPPTNSMSSQALWQKDAIFGLKQWSNDMTASDVAERRAAKDLGSVIWKKWHTYRRPRDNVSRVEDAHGGGIPVILAGTDFVCTSSGVSDAFNTVAVHHNHKNETRSRVNLGMKMHFKKPVKLVYDIAVDGSETTASLPTNRCYIYGTWWISDIAVLGSLDLYKGSVEMRWKDP